MYARIAFTVAICVYMAVIARDNGRFLSAEASRSLA